MGSLTEPYMVYMPSINLPSRHFRSSDDDGRRDSEEKKTSSKESTGTQASSHQHRNLQRKLSENKNSSKNERQTSKKETKKVFSKRKTLAASSSESSIHPDDESPHHDDSDLFELVHVAHAELVENQRATQLPAASASVSGEHAGLSASEASVSGALSNAIHTEFAVTRDSALQNFSTEPGTSGSAGMVAGSVFGSVGHESSSGLKTAVFTALTPDLRAVGVTLNKQVGPALIAGLILPSMVADSKLEITQFKPAEKRVELTYTSYLGAGLALTGGASFGLFGLGARIGLSKKKQTRIKQWVSLSDANKAMDSTGRLQRMLMPLGVLKSPLKSPDLQNPLGRKNSNIGAFGVHDEVQTVLSGAITGGGSLVAAGVHVGVNVTVTGTFERTVRRLDDNIMRVVLSPQKVVGAALAVDLPLVGAIDVTRAKGHLLRIAFDFDMSSVQGQTAYNNAVSGLLPYPPVNIDLTSVRSVNGAKAWLEDLRLPHGVTLAFVEQGQLENLVSYNAMATMWNYVFRSSLGAMQANHSRSETKSLVVTQQGALQRNEFAVSSGYQFFKKRGKQQTSSLIAQSIKGHDDDQGLEKLTLTMQIKQAVYNENAVGGVRSLLNDNILAGEKIAQTSFRGHESARQLEVTVERDLSLTDIRKLIEDEVIPHGKKLKEDLSQAGNNQLKINQILRRARLSIVEEIKQSRHIALGKIHRALAGNDDALVISISDVRSEQLQNKVRAMSVRLHAGISHLSGRRLIKAAQERAKDIDKLRAELIAAQARQETNPLKPHASRQKQEEHAEALSQALQTLTNLVGLQDLEKDQHDELLWGLKPSALRRMARVAQSPDISSSGAVTPATMAQDNGAQSSISTLVSTPQTSSPASSIETLVNGD